MLQVTYIKMVLTSIVKYDHNSRVKAKAARTISSFLRKRVLARKNSRAIVPFIPPRYAAGKKKIRIFRDVFKRSDAASRIQKFFRQRVAKRAAVKLNLQSSYARPIQALWRGFSSRRRHSALPYQREHTPFFGSGPHGEARRNLHLRLFRPDGTPRTFVENQTYGVSDRAKRIFWSKFKKDPHYYNAIKRSFLQKQQDFMESYAIQKASMPGYYSKAIKRYKNEVNARKILRAKRYVPQDAYRRFQGRPLNVARRQLISEIPGAERPATEAWKAGQEYINEYYKKLNELGRDKPNEVYRRQFEVQDRRNRRAESISRAALDFANKFQFADYGDRSHPPEMRRLDYLRTIGSRRAKVLWNYVLNHYSRSIYNQNLNKYLRML